MTEQISDYDISFYLAKHLEGLDQTELSIWISTYSAYFAMHSKLRPSVICDHAVDKANSAVEEIRKLVDLKREPHDSKYIPKK